MPELQIKVVTTVQGQGLQQAAADLAGLKGKLEGSNLASDKAEVSKSRLANAFKKLSSEGTGLASRLPFVGAAVSALLNPLSALTIAAGYAIAKFREFSAAADASAERMEAFSSASLHIRTFHKSLAETEAIRKRFAEQLDEIARKGKTVEELMSGLAEKEARKIGFEGNVAGKQAETAVSAIESLMQSGFLPRGAGAGMIQTIKSKALAGEMEREERGVRNEINVTSQGIDRTKDEIREAQAALPAAMAAEKAAKDKAADVARYQKAHLTELDLREPEVKKGIRELEPGFGSFLRALLRQGFWTGAAGGKAAGKEDAETLARLKMEARVIPAQRDMVEALSVETGRAFESATARRERLEGTISGGRERIRVLGIKRTALEEQLEATRGKNDQLSGLDGVQPELHAARGGPFTIPVTAAENDRRTGQARGAAARQAVGDLGRTLDATWAEVLSRLRHITEQMREMKSQIRRNEDR